MKLTKRAMFALLPSLAHLTFKGKGGGGGGSKTTTTLDPKVRDRIILPAYQAAERAAGATYTPGVDGAPGTYDFGDYEGYDGERIAPVNPYLLGAQNNVTRAIRAGDGQFTQASDVTAGLTGYQPQQVASRDIMNQIINAASLDRGSIRDVNNAGVTGADVAADAFGSLAPQARASIRDVAGQGFMGGNLAQYMNPYTDNVIDTTLQDLDRQRQIQQQQNAASAVNAGAFGGSRQGVVEAETNRGFADQASQIAAQLNAQRFDTAADLQQADADRALQAQLANQGVDLSTTQQALNLSGQFGLANQDANLRSQLANQGVDLDVGQLNTGYTQQANVQNAANNLTAQQSNQASSLQAAMANQDADLAGAQFRLGAAGQLAGLADQATNRELGDIDTNQTMGDILRGREQEQLDLAYQNFIDEKNYPIDQANILSGAAAGFPTGSVSRSSGGGGKIICTMMNESYGFGDFRNKLWIEQSKHLDPAIERGYHTIFLPVIAFAKGDGWMSRMARKIMEHGARHRTADIWKQKRGKRDRIGQAYRLVFEPICYVVGKVVK